MAWGFAIPVLIEALGDAALPSAGPDPAPGNRAPDLSVPVFVYATEALVAIGEPAVEPLYDAKAGWWMARELGLRLGLDKFFVNAVAGATNSAMVIDPVRTLAPGERVVDRGAYLIRLAAMSTQIPAHGHVH